MNDNTSDVETLQNQLEEHMQEVITKYSLPGEYMDDCCFVLSEILPVIHQNDELKNILTTWLNGEDKMLLDHSLTLAYVTFLVVESLSWGSRTQQTKLVFAALFHDMVLNERPEFHLLDPNNVEEENLSTNEKHLLNIHNMKAAKIVKQCQGVPEGVDDLISYHHIQNTEELSPLSSIFLISEKFLRGLEDGKSQQEIIDSLYKKYQISNRVAVVALAESLHLKKTEE